jgi:hypothetical protein
MFKIQRSIDGRLVVFALSGRIKAPALAELQKVLDSEADHHRVVLDLKEVNFLADCEAKCIKLANCPAYIREWIEKEEAQKRVPKVSRSF